MPSPPELGTVPDETGGPSILRTDPESERIRSRTEGPARVGRYALTVLGAVAAAAGGALWVTGPAAPAVAFVVFGGAMIGLGILFDRLLRRERIHRVEQVHLWDEGVEVVLANGEIRVATWNDPKFALELYLRSSKGAAGPEVLLAWRMDSRLPLIPITAEGSDRLRQMAERAGLRCVELNPSRRKHGTRAITIYAEKVKPPAPLVPAKSKESTY